MPVVSGYDPVSLSASSPKDPLVVHVDDGSRVNRIWNADRVEQQSRIAAQLESDTVASIKYRSHYETSDSFKATSAMLDSMLGSISITYSNAHKTAKPPYATSAPVLDRYKKFATEYGNGQLEAVVVEAQRERDLERMLPSAPYE